jgi:hypothetical protein
LQVCDSFLTVKSRPNENKGIEQEPDERQLPPPTSSSSAKRNDNSKLSEEETSNTSLHDTTVMTYLSSMLTTDEAMNIEIQLMKQYNDKENEIKLLLNELYDVDKSSDVTHTSKSILSIEAAIAGMADITDEYTLATAMPRSDFF